jgi:hypothetical protein
MSHIPRRPRIYRTSHPGWATLAIEDLLDSRHRRRRRPHPGWPVEPEAIGVGPAAGPAARPRHPNATGPGRWVLDRRHWSDRPGRSVMTWTEAFDLAAADVVKRIEPEWSPQQMEAQNQHHQWLYTAITRASERVCVARLVGWRR